MLSLIANEFQHPYVVAPEQLRGAARVTEVRVHMSAQLLGHGNGRAVVVYNGEVGDGEFLDLQNG